MAEKPADGVVKPSLEKLKALQLAMDKVEKMPANWINGFDSNQKIANEELYDLKAMPTLYLLDKGKKVLLKDADLDEILLFLQNTKN